MRPDGQRAVLGRLLEVFGALHAAPAAVAWLASGGPAPLIISPRAWSAYFFIHFLALTVSGVAFIWFQARRTRVFHGGPLVDFAAVIAGLTVVETLGGGPSSWRGFLPAAFLVGCGLRLETGIPLFGRQVSSPAAR